MHLEPSLSFLQLRHQEGKGPGRGGSRPHEDATPESGLDQGGPSLRCVQCRHRITYGRARIEMQGQHRHVFFNPHGHMFELGCFSQAPGCGAVGPSSEEFTWFAGYAWQVALCAGCGLHMGWLYRSVQQGGAFWGLILPNLVEEEDD